MDDFVFAERAARVLRALTAEQVLHIKRPVQWGLSELDIYKI